MNENKIYFFQCTNPECAESGTSTTQFHDCIKCGSFVNQRLIINCASCGKEITLFDGFENECECGELYNGFGQHLLPRDEWEKDY